MITTPALVSPARGGGRVRATAVAVGPSPSQACLAVSLAPPAHAHRRRGLYAGDFDVGLSAFCRGGHRSAGHHNEARGAALQIAGQLLRRIGPGSLGSEAKSNEFRNRFRISTPQQDTARSLH